METVGACISLLGYTVQGSVEMSVNAYGLTSKFVANSCGFFFAPAINPNVC